MSDQGDLFHEPTPRDPEEGIRKRDEAIDRVEENAGERWQKLAWDAFTRVYARGRPFTSDDIVELLDTEGNWPPPNDERAMGAVIRRAIARRLIGATGERRPASYARAHGRPQTVWAPLSKGS